MSCPTKKKIYPSKDAAEDALIRAWTQYNYSAGNGPVAVYKCEDCGQYHLTSKGPMNERLAQNLAQGNIRRQNEADWWSDKLT
jgi:hypothetical protein